MTDIFQVPVAVDIADYNTIRRKLTKLGLNNRCLKKKLILQAAQQRYENTCVKFSYSYNDILWYGVYCICKEIFEQSSPSVQMFITMKKPDFRDFIFSMNDDCVSHVVFSEWYHQSCFHYCDDLITL